MNVEPQEEGRKRKRVKEVPEKEKGRTNKSGAAERREKGRTNNSEATERKGKGNRELAPRKRECSTIVVMEREKKIVLRCTCRCVSDGRVGG